MINIEITKSWIKVLKEFAKFPSHRHLRFPMFIEGTSGEMYSPEGLLCNLHAKANGKDWLPEKLKGGRLRGYVTYMDAYETAPEEVLKWSGIEAGEMSILRNVNYEKGFDGLVEHLEKHLEVIKHYGKKK